MIALFKASRPLNLLIVALTQYLFYFFLFLKPNGSFDLLLSHRLLFTFIVVTVIISACGYYINDYFDYETDQTNLKTDKLSHRGTYLISYFTLFIVGWILSIWIAYEIDKLFLSVIYLIATGLLYLYSSHFKRMPLSGNLIVAIFSAFVIGIILYAELDTVLSDLWQNTVFDGQALQIIFFYLLFIFMLSFIREIIKDIEDIDGDRKLAYRTYPIVVGVKSAKKLSFALTIVLFIIACSWLYYSWFSFSLLLNIWYVISIILPSLYILILIKKSLLKNDFAHISSVCKLLMFSGLIYIIALGWT